MPKRTIKPYANESDVIELGNITIENRLDRISIYGSIDIWKDKDGLNLARELKAILDQTVETLERENLPNRVKAVAPELVSNPFA